MCGCMYMYKVHADASWLANASVPVEAGLVQEPVGLPGFESLRHQSAACEIEVGCLFHSAGNAVRERRPASSGRQSSFMRH